VSKQTVVTGHARNELANFDLNLERYAIGDTNGNITILAASNNLVLMVLPASGYTLEGVDRFTPNGRYLGARYWREHEGVCYWVWNVDNQTVAVRALQQEDSTNQL
jgi:hypothetical protein